MRAAGAMVSIIIYGQGNDEFFEEDGIMHYRVQNIEQGKLKRYHTQKKIGRLLRSLIRQQKVNIVEAPDWRGITSFLSVKCPLVVKIHGSDAYFAHLDQKPIKWRIRFAERRALQKANAVVSVSKYAASITASLFSLKKKIAIIPNGIDINQFEVLPSNSTVNVLYFGTLVRKKGSLELPHIFKKVIEQCPDAQLSLVGLNSDDPATGNPSVWQMIQEALSPQARLQTQYLGSVPYSEVKNYIAEAAVCIFPSYAEALPVSWMEAMAMGKAIVASDIGWASEMITDGHEGFLVHPSSHDLFAAKIVQLLKDPKLRQDLGDAARRKAENQFSTAAVAAQNLEFYHNLIRRK